MLMGVPGGLTQSPHCMSDTLLTRGSRDARALDMQSASVNGGEE